MAVTLISLSLSALRAGHHRRALRLLATVSRCRIQTQDEAAYGEAVSALREAVGASRFEGLWSMAEPVPFDEVSNEIAALAAELGSQPDRAMQPVPYGTVPLSRREREVLRLVAEGRSNRAIGEALSISERTVENHVTHVLAKPDLESRTAAAAWAVRNGLG